MPKVPKINEFCLFYDKVAYPIFQITQHQAFGFFHHGSSRNYTEAMYSKTVSFRVAPCLSVVILLSSGILAPTPETRHLSSVSLISVL
jgi:hypothetical protein